MKILHSFHSNFFLSHSISLFPFFFIRERLTYFFPVISSLSDHVTSLFFKFSFSSLSRLHQFLYSLKLLLLCKNSLSIFLSSPPQINSLISFCLLQIILFHIFLIFFLPIFFAYIYFFFLFTYLSRLIRHQIFLTYFSSFSSLSFY